MAKKKIRKKKVSPRNKKAIKVRDRIKRRSAIITSLIFSGLLIVFLILGFSTPLPLPSEQGIDVILGEHDMGMDNPVENIEETSEMDQLEEELQAKEAPETSEEIQQPDQTTESSSEVSEQESMTQETEEAPVINKKETKKEPSKEEVKEETDTKTESTEKDKKETQPERKPNEDFLFTPKKDKGQGDDKEQGEKGSKEGVENVESFEKYGESDNQGKGINLNLAGRSIVQYPPKPEDIQKAGIVVVEITVNRQGTVIKAKPGIRGSTTMDQQLLNLAREQALKTKLNSDPAGPEEQVGKMTFTFKLQ